MSTDQSWERALLGYARLANTAALAGVLCARGRATSRPGTTSGDQGGARVMQDGRKDELDEAWARWEAALACVRERAPGRPSRREQRLWLLAHICSVGMLSYAIGYAVHRDGPWSWFVLLPSVVLACTLALIVVRLWAL